MTAPIQQATSSLVQRVSKAKQHTLTLLTHRQEGYADNDVKEVVGDGGAGAAAKAQVLVPELLLLLLLGH